MKERWSWSHDGQLYHGGFDTKEEAVSDGRKCCRGEKFFVGQCFEPTRLSEMSGLGELLIEHLTCQDEYHCDAADGSYDVRKEVLEDLDRRISKAITEWEKEHGVDPGFFIVPEFEEISAPGE